MLRDLVAVVVWFFALIGLAACLAILLLSLGCAGQVGPVAFAFGQASVCRGPADSYYSAATGTLEAERCEGGYVTGGPVSEPAGRALGTAGRALVRMGGALGGLPAPAEPRGAPGCPECAP